MKVNMYQLFTDAFAAGQMCKGCYVKAIACPDLNYKCPICDVEEEEWSIVGCVQQYITIGFKENVYIWRKKNEWNRRID